MISTSDGETYEDATAHALGVPQPVTAASSSTASRMPPEAPTEPAGAFKSEQATPVAGSEKKLYIIRHGSTDMNGESNVSTDRIRGWKDVPLNDEGRQDAEKAGQKLAQMEPPTIMHHSDLDRASETAGIISKHIDTPTAASRDLRPWDLGELTGTSTKEAIPQIEDYVKNKPDQAVPKGESFNEFKERAFRGIHSALNSGDSPVAIVTHHRLERLLEAWNKKGQPADHSIDLDTFTQKGDPPGGIKEMMIHQPEQQPDMVQKTIRATIQHFKNAFMEGPNLMKDFMEGKVTSEDEDAIRRAMNVGWKTTPIARFKPTSSLRSDSPLESFTENSPSEYVNMEFNALYGDTTSPKAKPPVGPINIPARKGDWEAEMLSNFPPKGYMQPKDTMKDYKKQIEEKRYIDEHLTPSQQFMRPTKELVIPGMQDYIRSKDLGQEVKYD